MQREEQRKANYKGLLLSYRCSRMEWPPSEWKTRQYFDAVIVYAYDFTTSILNVNKTLKIIK